MSIRCSFQRKVATMVVMSLSPIILALLVLLTACAPVSTTPVPLLSETPPAPPQWTPLPSPPTPPVVLDYVEGMNEMPPDTYLFVEYWTDYRGISTSGKCDGAAMIDFPTYSYSDGSLDAAGIDLSRGSRNMASPPVGFFGYGRSHSGAMGGGADSELYTIEELPYTMLAHGRYEIGVIHSVDAQGNIIVEMGNTSHLIESGRAWVQISEKDTSPECHLVTTTRLRNHGLLDVGQVTTGADSDLEYLQRTGVTIAPHHLCWTGDSTTLILATREGIRLYSTSLTETEHWATTAPILSAAVSPDDQTLATADAYGSIQLWNIPSGQAIGDPMSDPPGPWLSLAYNPSGKTLASGSYDGIIQIWDTETGKAIGTPWTDRMPKVVDLVFNPDGRLLLSSSGGNSIVRMWQVATGQPERWNRECGPVALDPDGTSLACLDTDPGDGSPTLYIADLESSEVLGLMANPPKAVYDLSFSPDSTMLAGGSDYGRIQLWNASTGDVQGHWTLANGEWFDYVTSVVFSPDGTKLAAFDRTGAHNWTIWLLDIETGQTVQVGGDW